MPADDYVPSADPPTGGDPVVFHPATFARHARAVDRVLGDNQARYPRVGRGRTTDPARGAWGYLATGHTITAGSGLVLGSGTVTLCSRSGSNLTADGDDVTVLNSGATITGPKILELEWMDGAWAVCECGAPTCSPCSIPEDGLTLCAYSTVFGDASAAFTLGPGTAIWTANASGGGSTLTVTLTCPAGLLRVSAISSSGLLGQCTWPTPLAANQCLTLTSFTCSPFFFDFAVFATGCTCFNLIDGGYQRFVITEEICP